MFLNYHWSYLLLFLFIFFCMLSFCCSLNTIHFQNMLQQERPLRSLGRGRGLTHFLAMPNRPTQLPNNRLLPTILPQLLRPVGLQPYPKWIYPKLAYPNYLGLAVAIDLTVMPTQPMAHLPMVHLPTPKPLPLPSTDIMTILEILDRNSKCHFTLG